jgi:hypothetical protein
VRKKIRTGKVMTECEDGRSEKDERGKKRTKERKRMTQKREIPTALTQGGR